MDTVYLETTIVGHVAGRIRPDPETASRQRVTRAWWASAQSKYNLLISQVVLDECTKGDPQAAKERLELIDSLPLLDLTEEVHYLAKDHMVHGAVPQTEPRDSLHIAVSAVHGVHYLLTWNFKHIANATLRTRIESICRDQGYEPPVICTPEELSETIDVE